MASLTPTFFTVGLSYFTDLPASVCVCSVFVCVCVCVCVCARVGKGPFYPLFLLSHSLSLAPSLCLSLLMWVIDMQQCIPGSYRRACSHGYCRALWQIRHRDTGPWTFVTVWVGHKTCNVEVKGPLIYRMSISVQNCNCSP